MDYLIAKSIHIIFVVSYFAGIFYMVRLFVYHTEALLNENDIERSVLHKQFSYMQERLWNIITVPALVMMFLSGIYLLYLTDWMWLKQGWMHIKLFFIILLLIYHFWCWKIMKKLQKARITHSSVGLRMANEVATLILFVVVFAVILKDVFVAHWYWAAISFLSVGLFIMFIVRLVNKIKR